MTTKVSHFFLMKNNFYNIGYNLLLVKPIVSIFLKLIIKSPTPLLKKSL